MNNLSMRCRKVWPDRTQGDGIGEEIVSDRARISLEGSNPSLVSTLMQLITELYHESS